MRWVLIAVALLISAVVLWWVHREQGGRWQICRRPADRRGAGQCDRPRALWRGCGFHQHVLLRDQQSLFVQRRGYRGFRRGDRAGPVQPACEKRLVTLGKAMRYIRSRNRRRRAMSVPRVTAIDPESWPCRLWRPGRGCDAANIKHTGEGPDEFTVLPTRPLQTPESYSALPAPTPGARTLSTQSQGRRRRGAWRQSRRADRTAAAAADSGLVRHAGRYGAQPGIRQTLAREDAETRRKHGRVNILRLGPVDDYTDAYKRQWLDADSEEMRLRRAGVEHAERPAAQRLRRITTLSARLHRGLADVCFGVTTAGNRRDGMRQFIACLILALAAALPAAAGSRIRSRLSRLITAWMSS